MIRNVLEIVLAFVGFCFSSIRALSSSVYGIRLTALLERLYFGLNNGCASVLKTKSSRLI